MKQLKNIILILVAIAIAFFIYTHENQKNAQQQTAGEYQLFMPKLRDEFNKITKITLQNGESLTSLIKGDDGKWRVAEKHNYSANMQELRKMLLYLSQSELRERKTNNPEQFNRLGLDDLQGNKVTIYADEQPLYKLVLGNLNKDANATYVRFADDNQTYKASGELQFNANPDKWLDFTFLSISPERVQQIDFQFKGRKPYQYVRQSPEEQMQLTPAPDGKLVVQKNDLRNPATYFERLAFTDVMLEDIGAIKNGVTTLTTFDGLQISFEFYEINFMPWVKVQANVNTDIRSQFAQMPLKPLAEIEEEAKQINSITKGWLYQLGQFQQQNLSRSYLDLTEVKTD
jgi:competence protein ComGF